MRTRALLAALAAASLAAPAAGAQVTGPVNAAQRGDDVVLLIALSDDGEVASVVGARMLRYVTEAIHSGGSVGTPRQVQIERVTHAGLEPAAADDDGKEIARLLSDHRAEAALTGDVVYADNLAVMRAILTAPQTRGDRPDHWIVRAGDQSVDLPLAYGAYRFQAISLSSARVAPTGAQAFVASVAGATRLIGLNNLPLLKPLYAEEATTTEDGLASFVGGIAAYRAGDFVRAERLFRKAREIARPGSRTRADAAVLQLASAARAVPLVAEAKGKESVWPWSHRLSNVKALGKQIREEFPWSVDARRVLAMFYIEVAANAPDSVFKGGSFTRSWAAGEARDYLRAVDRLTDGDDPWTPRARKLVDAISR